ncbi:MAG: UvrB/UvrC motif-containing protein, partial [Opitutia bacterium]
GRRGGRVCGPGRPPLLGPRGGTDLLGAAPRGRAPAGARSPEQMRRRLEAARREMEAAVETEDYEAAARLRDLIRELESQLA